MTENFKYTVLMSVYIKVKPEEFKIAVDSMLAQTLPPSEFIIVKDGPLTDELNNLIDGYWNKYPSLFKTIQLEKNVGLGSAYAEGTLHCTTGYIAIMDCDDYSAANRCEKEAEYFLNYPDTDIVGCCCYDFQGSIKNIIDMRKMPETHSECVKFAHSRCPCIHPSTMLKKKALEKAGGYKKCMLAEDYDLYVRMMMSGCIFHNLSEPLVYVRVSPDFYERRGGIAYLKKVIAFKKSFFECGFYSRLDLIRGIAVHTAVCIMPNFLRAFIYKRLLRTHHKGAPDLNE